MKFDHTKMIDIKNLVQNKSKASITYFRTNTLNETKGHDIIWHVSYQHIISPAGLTCPTQTQFPDQRPQQMMIATSKSRYDLGVSGNGHLTRQNGCCPDEITVLLTPCTTQYHIIKDRQYTDRHPRIDRHDRTTLIARCMGPTRGPTGADRTQVGPMLVP